MTDLTERCWIFDTLAVIVERVDFLDPALAGQPDIRERGVRVELRPVQRGQNGSIYSSLALSLDPAVCRIDLLESAPGKADRMHWHPVMINGEPDDRVFDVAMPADPIGWLSARLRDVDSLLDQAGVTDRARHAGAVSAIAAESEEIVTAVRAGLDWARQPWPVVDRNERGMAIPAT